MKTGRVSQIMVVSEEAAAEIAGEDDLDAADIANDGPNADKTAGAGRAPARALLRIRSMRTDLMAKFELGCDHTRELRRVAALDRYERYLLPDADER
jgi:hypothetical protein